MRLLGSFLSPRAAVACGKGKGKTGGKPYHGFSLKRPFPCPGFLPSTLVVFHGLENKPSPGLPVGKGKTKNTSQAQL